ncbi:hypothetical protein [Streptomyces noursei]|uniref:hypothetical protein n=1 Tax=Streptomyces noursei TaxID=1971 RepID=UPI00081CD701|nr:hypothetical protein [Streptomyces noursei]ANZ16846.1 hypothetical protein SNOUR_17735 [Streptomyces noursei ATCC 11455]MCZ0993857.1 hypothetical protein [Streptomyces noursei]MCZ1017500.1 hypothetical protein [Streptomyces noursei]GGX19667.1 hypothetical protein GCM10010341_46370 [Streptomyces noursei]
MTAWTQWRDRIGQAWNRHVRYRESYRQLDAVRDALKARTAWVDALTEEELAEMQRGVAEYVEALRSASGDAPERPEGTS